MTASYTGKYKRNPAMVERLEKIKLFHGMGMTTKEISRVLDIKQHTIAYYERQMGLPPIRKNETQGIRSVKTLEICERCKFADCRWNGISPVCPMEFSEKEDGHY